MSRSLVYAIRAIETADEAANVGGLRSYCVGEMGMDDADLQELIDSPYPTDLGRVQATFRKKDAKAKAAAAAATLAATKKKAKTTKKVAKKTA